MASGALEGVVLAFSDQLSALHGATALRGDEPTTGFHREELAALEGRLRGLESRMEELVACLGRERAALPAARALLAAAGMQADQLAHVAAHLPTYLPGPALPDSPRDAPEHVPESCSLMPEGEEQQHQQPEQRHRQRRAPGQENPTEPSFKPRYISHAELDGLSAYMRGRLTADRANAALDELAEHASRNAALVAAARRGRATGAVKQHAMWLAYSVAVKEELHGTRWVLESDLRSGSALRMDKTGRATLTALRHLGRVAEVRVAVDGSLQLIILLKD